MLERPLTRTSERQFQSISHSPVIVRGFYRIFDHLQACPSIYFQYRHSFLLMDGRFIQSAKNTKRKVYSLSKKTMLTNFNLQGLGNKNCNTWIICEKIRDQIEWKKMNIVNVLHADFMHNLNKFCTHVSIFIDIWFSPKYLRCYKLQENLIKTSRKNTDNCWT